MDQVLPTHGVCSVSGGAREDRTPDLLRARQALSQLSYGPILVGLGGLEPPTSPLSGVRSNHLSYRPVFVDDSICCAGLSSGDRSMALGILIKQWLWTLKCSSDLYKEVIQPQVPLRLPCYDFTPVMNHKVVSALPKVRLPTSFATHSHGVTGGVYKARERIHRGILIRDY